MANFRVGQKVVCVDVTPNLRNNPMPLVKGCVYTVKMIVPHEPWWLINPGCDGVHLSEVNCFVKWGFSAHRFRPVYTIESDREMFKRISEDAKGRMDILEEMLNE